MKVTKYSDNVPALESLRGTDVYQIADKIARHVRPTAQEAAYIAATIRRQGISPTGLLLRGWLFDFSAIMRERDRQLTIFPDSQ